MGENWSADEVSATVADYFEMLQRELRREPYNKTQHRNQLQAILRGRSGPAIEFKHANISAVLVELGLPYIGGYKPRGNYQELLRTEVIAQLRHDSGIVHATLSIVDAPAPLPGELPSVEDVFVSAPSRRTARAGNERRVDSANHLGAVNYLEREARNSSLGLAGEQFVLQVEYRRLWKAGAGRLADRIEHVAVTQGDGLGYDIVSFDTDGRERLIEVKTTAFGSMTPFFASAKEVAVSHSREGFFLYRVFSFRDAARIFTLPGSLRRNCTLDPVQFRASLV